MIKFLDLHKMNARFESQFQEKFKQFLDSGHYVLGNEVKIFEENYANYCGTKYCIGVSTGLDALLLIFKAYIELGMLEKGDEVIVPANTFIASIIAIEHVGLKPVLVEPDIETYNISVLEIEKHITHRTKVILAVHLYGMLADMSSIKMIAKEKKLLVIEDAAQAHGAIDTANIKAGNFGNAAAFSFYPSKNLGALGDAGAVTTNNELLFSTIKKMRSYGASSKYVYDLIGTNNRLDEIQAAFLNIKLRELDSDNDRRREVAKYYLENIKNSKITLPYYNQSKNHVFHVFMVLTESRQDFMKHLSVNAIETQIHYPIPPHKQKAFSHLKIGFFPITEAIHDKTISLPLSPIMTKEEVEEVVNAINKY